MREVRVKTSELLSKVQANRDQHRGQWEKAIVGWRRETSRTAQNLVTECENGTRLLAVLIDHPPEDHTRDYDRVLEMLTMCQDVTVTIDQQTFRQYVLDDWQWKEAWSVSNSKYLGS